MQDVLHADWHEAWHLPQPPFLADSLRLALLIVLMCFILKTSCFPITMLSAQHRYIFITIISQYITFFNSFLFFRYFRQTSYFESDKFDLMTKSSLIILLLLWYLRIYLSGETFLRKGSPPSPLPKTFNTRISA